MATVEAKIIPGYGVASGSARDSRFPLGTIMMQTPHFQRRGLDISGYYPATVNVAIAPYTLQIRKPIHYFSDIKWSRDMPSENFYFFDAIADYFGQLYEGLIYMPDPCTKTEHTHTTDTLELLLPKIPDLNYHNTIKLSVKDDQLNLSPQP